MCIYQTNNEQMLTFDPDVAVPLKVMVGSLPGVPVVSQECDGWARPDWHVSNTFFIFKRQTSELTLIQKVTDHIQSATLHCESYQHIPSVETPVAPPCC